MGIEFTQFWKYWKRWHTSEVSSSMLTLGCLLWNFTVLNLDILCNFRFTNLIFEYDTLHAVFNICLRKSIPFQLLRERCPKFQTNHFSLFIWKFKWWKNKHQNYFLSGSHMWNNANNTQYVQILHLQNIVSFNLRTYNWGSTIGCEVKMGSV